MDLWKNLNLHLENLLPGVVTLAILSGQLPEAAVKQLLTDPVTNSDLARGGLFVAAAYLVGVVAVALARLLDKCSAWGPRYIMFRLLAIDKESIKGTGINSLNEEYRRRIKTALWSRNPELIGELSRRRERLHLLRAATVPAVLSVVMWHSNLWLRLLWGAIVLIVSLFLYAYLEVSVYDETCLGEPPNTC